MNTKRSQHSAKAQGTQDLRCIQTQGRSRRCGRKDRSRGVERYERSTRYRKPKIAGARENPRSQPRCEKIQKIAPLVRKDTKDSDTEENPRDRSWCTKPAQVPRRIRQFAAYEPRTAASSCRCYLEIRTETRTDAHHRRSKLVDETLNSAGIPPKK